ncbi:hypothetical protein WJX73_002970 [Symbiochloris irregularis]|uniref:Uncharacterized protein n=1 Tax=Symbiochloris irregularis TaxID=706552 RepID=A0AAW1NKZ2_9CHLO
MRNEADWLAETHTWLDDTGLRQDVAYLVPSGSALAFGQQRIARPLRCTATSSSARAAVPKQPSSWSDKFGPAKRRLTRQQLERAPTSLLSTALLARDWTASQEAFDAASVQSASGAAAARDVSRAAFEKMEKELDDCLAMDDWYGADKAVLTFNVPSDDYGPSEHHPYGIIIGHLVDISQACQLR